MEDPFLNYFALGLLFFVIIVLVYGIIAIHDIPAKIAHARHHPHQDAIHAAGWISLFMLHVLWPFLWIWAMMYRPDRGWGFSHKPGEPSTPSSGKIDQFTPKGECTPNQTWPSLENHWSRRRLPPRQRSRQAEQTIA